RVAACAARIRLAATPMDRLRDIAAGHVPARSRRDPRRRRRAKGRWHPRGSRLAHPDTRGRRSRRRAPSRGLAHRAGVMVAAFRRFDPYAVLVVPPDRGTLATLESLADVPAEIEIREERTISVSGLAG